MTRIIGVQHYVTGVCSGIAHCLSANNRIAANHLHSLLKYVNILFSSINQGINKFPLSVLPWL